MDSTPSPDSPPAPPGYRELREGVAWADVGPRTAVVVAGEDAVRFVDGFCTAAVAAVPAGAGVEAMFLDSRGQVILWGTVFRTPDGVWIDADPVPPSGDEPRPPLADHLERYHIRERLSVADVSERLAWILVGGPGAAAWLERSGIVPPESSPIGHGIGLLADLEAGNFPARCAGGPALVLRGEWAGPGSFLVVVPRSARETVVAALEADGVATASPAALDAVRREESRPAPVDIVPRALPQELGRDRRAISFTKGCYLGQETVARLDAIGHVNRRLVGVVVAGTAALAAGAAVEDDSGVVGTVTSAGPSPRHGGWLGLAFVRTSALRTGARVSVAGRVARIVGDGTAEGGA